MRACLNETLTLRCKMLKLGPCSTENMLRLNLTSVVLMELESRHRVGLASLAAGVGHCCGLLRAGQLELSHRDVAKGRITILG